MNLKTANDVQFQSKICFCIFFEMIRKNSFFGFIYLIIWRYSIEEKTKRQKKGLSSLWIPLLFSTKT
jgi:hypothetical protein